MIQKGEVFRARAYQRAQQEIFRYKKDITSVEQIKDLPNIGATIFEKLQELELALEQVLKQRAFIGNTMRDLQEAQQKQEVQIFDQERRLSEIRDADLAESALHLKTAELNNRVSLDAGSRLIQPSLTDFLR